MSLDEYKIPPGGLRTALQTPWPEDEGLMGISDRQAQRGQRTRAWRAVPLSNTGVGAGRAGDSTY